MVKIALQIYAILENVSSISTCGEDYRYFLKLKCTGCHEIADSWQYVSLSESTDTKGGRGTASMVQKCKMCSRENHIDIIKEKVKPYTAENDQQYSSIVAFECRGMEPTDFDFRNGWTVELTTSRTVFNDVDLSSKEWFDYDEASNESVSVTELQHQFIKLKK